MHVRAMDMETRIRDSFDRQAMMATFSADISEITKGSVTIRAPITREVSQQQGMAHGGLGFAIGDSAAGYAALTLLDLTDEVVTSEMSIHYVAPGIGDYLIAKGRVIKPGRRMIVVAADVYALKTGQETHIATLMGTMVRVAAQRQ